ncbi:hypothetical protein DENSPDRAFT_933896 [Dentipellis sp. KUC8613]|nr:hypothetical protein DENSPDRAFT_933896 [Dentipellis sp. KUC8613]
MTSLAPAPTSTSASTSNPPQEKSDPELTAQIFQRLRPRVYLERFLAQGFRPDGRTLDAWRDVSVHTGSITTAEGSALVRLGGTTVVVGVKAEIAPPELDAPDAGFLVPNLDLPALCSPRFKPGPPSEEAQVLSARLNDALLASAILPLTTLCIEPGKAAWVLYVDATCINYDGNAFDAALLGMVAALRNTRLPQATYNPDTGRTLCSRKTRTPLQLGARVPAAYSFGIFNSTSILADPTAFEEPLLDATLTITLDAPSGALLGTAQLGLALPDDTLARCVALAQRRHAEVRAVYLG